MIKRSIKSRKSPNSETIKFVDTIQKGEWKGTKVYNAGYIWPARYETKYNQYYPIEKGRVYDRRGTELIQKVYIPDNRRILLPNKKYILIIDYPLRNKYEQEIITGKKGMVLREVLNIAVDAYKKIYKEERKTSKLKEESISKRSKGKSLLINRAETDGKYGIWGHGIEDLTITNIMVKGNKIYLSVDS